MENGIEPNETFKLNDIANDLLILNKTTIDKLFLLENPADCIALYILYYKTAKWQKTNIVKATDEYVKKILNWGADKTKKTKKILKENGLINIIQRRTDNKISGWYVEVLYLVNKQKENDIKIKVENINNTTEKQELSFPRSSYQNTNALKEYIICLKKENISSFNELKEIFLENSDNKNYDSNELKNHFEDIWQIYPRKEGKAKACTYFLQWVKGKTINGIKTKLTDEQIYMAVLAYKKKCEKENTEKQYIKKGENFFKDTILDYVENKDE